MAEEIYQLVMRKGPKPGEIISLATATAVLGRDPACEVYINDAEISRNHAKLTRSEAGYLIQDLGSTNGTFVDGRRLRGEPVLLTSGQTVIIGSNVLLVYEAMTNTGDPLLATMVSAANETQQVGRYVPKGYEEPGETILGEDVPEVEQPHISSAYIPSPKAANVPVTPQELPKAPPPEPVRYTPPPASYSAAPPPPEPFVPNRNTTWYWVLGIGGVLLLCLCCLLLVTGVYLFGSNGGQLPF